MKKPIVINLFGGPGCGKSTGAAYIFAMLKIKGVNCELVTEYAKDKTWEHNTTALGCQEHVFGRQSYRMARCRNDVEVIVTDSPLPLSVLYNKNPALDINFERTVINIFNTYENMNYYINRVKPYNPKGRNQTEAESDALATSIKELLYRNNVLFRDLNGDDEGYKSIVKDVLNKIENLQEE